MRQRGVEPVIGIRRIRHRHFAHRRSDAGDDIRQVFVSAGAESGGVQRVQQRRNVPVRHVVQFDILPVGEHDFSAAQFVGQTRNGSGLCGLQFRARNHHPHHVQSGLLLRNHFLSVQQHLSDRRRRVFGVFDLVESGDAAFLQNTNHDLAEAFGTHFIDHNFQAGESALTAVTVTAERFDGGLCHRQNQFFRHPVKNHFGQIGAGTESAARVEFPADRIAAFHRHPALTVHQRLRPRFVGERHTDFMFARQVALQVPYLMIGCQHLDDLVRIADLFF